MFGELIDRKVKDAKSVRVVRDAGFAVCCLDMQNFVVRVWVKKAFFLTMKVPCIDFEGVIYYLVVLFWELLLAISLGRPSELGTKALGLPQWYISNNRRANMIE